MLKINIRIYFQIYNKYKRIIIKDQIQLILMQKMKIQITMMK